jgi:hypothetical protein
MPRLHGYSTKGQRCYGKHDWGAKGRTNVIGALLGGVLLTASLFQASIDTEIFTQWVKQDLIPQLPPHSVIILDNASFHKGAVMQHAIKETGHTLFYLPTYSPDRKPSAKLCKISKNLGYDRQRQKFFSNGLPRRLSNISMSSCNQ